MQKTVTLTTIVILCLANAPSFGQQSTDATQEGTTMAQIDPVAGTETSGTEIAPNPMDPAEALRIVGLGERLDHFPAQLSGGEQQRVAIARAIAKRPALLLCDEPTGALDSQTGVLVLEAIERIHAELGTTTVLITHNAVIADMTDRVLVMGDGQIVEERRNSSKLRAAELHW